MMVRSSFNPRMFMVADTPLTDDSREFAPDRNRQADGSLPGNIMSRPEYLLKTLFRISRHGEPVCEARETCVSPQALFAFCSSEPPERYVVKLNADLSGRSPEIHISFSPLDFFRPLST